MRRMFRRDDKDNKDSKDSADGETAVPGASSQEPAGGSGPSSSSSSNAGAVSGGATATAPAPAPASSTSRSNASTFSRPSVVSSYQSSLFSSQPSNATTADTSIHSARGPKPETQVAGAGAGVGVGTAAGQNSAPSADAGERPASVMSSASASGRLMRVMNMDDVSSSYANATPPSRSRPTQRFNSHADPYHIIELPPASSSSEVFGSPTGTQRRHASSNVGPGSGAASIHSHSPAASPSRIRSHAFHSTATTARQEFAWLASELTHIYSRVTATHTEIAQAANAMCLALRTSTESAVVAAVEHEVELPNEPALCAVVRTVLAMADNVLGSVPQYRGPKMLLLQALAKLGAALNLLPETPLHSTVKQISNFAIGSNTHSHQQLPGETLLEIIMDALAGGGGASGGGGGPLSPVIAEQEGAFAAPVLRGLSPEFAVPAVAFGFPDPKREHYALVSVLQTETPDLHLFCYKNYIRACSGPIFKAPYRTPTDPMAPPMSLSVAADNARNLSGTIGGYLYPKIGPTHPFYSSYGKSTFAITCAHTCLSESGGIGQPWVSTPSPVLIGLYRNALVQEGSKYNVRSQEYAGYQKVIDQLDSLYPIDQETNRNRPRVPLGRISWAERRVINGSLSDLAIIKCSDDLKCRNYLGDDVPFSEYDPALMYGNLYVKRIARKLIPGTKVFKYGSTSKYSRGRINGLRIVYWSSGRLQSSEFAIASDNLFATGGDSGAWILQKSEDAFAEDDGSSTARYGSEQASTASARSSLGPSLCTAGMLHSYDGERKEFGLFTPMETILQRLHQVTNIKWGVVGVPDEDNEDIPAGGSESSDSGVESVSD